MSYNKVVSNKLEGGVHVMKSVYLFVGDGYLRRKLQLELMGDYECLSPSGERCLTDGIIITDGIQSLPNGLTADLVISDGGDIPPQFLIGEVRQALSERKSRGRLIPNGERQVLLDGREIKLTELEHSLLLVLYEARGELVDRETLCRRVFGQGGDGMLNLYVHYLREKLEVSGEKVILSSRRGGYRISADFIDRED